MNVRRVVLDTNYFRGSKEPDLRALRSKGYSVHISANALIETWARSMDSADAGIVYGPVKKFAPFVDKDFPIAPCGADLVRVLGGHWGKARVDPSDYARTARRIWKTLAAAQGSSEEWKRSGQSFKTYNDQYAKRWQDLATPWLTDAKRKGELDKGVAEFAKAPDQLREKTFTHITTVCRDPGLKSPIARDRFNAFFRTMSLRLASNATGATESSRNDAMDLVQLEHIGWPAFFVTSDIKLMKDVLAARTYQSIWVRTLFEMIHDEMPTCLPWQSAAGKLTDARTAADVKGNALREQEWLKKIRGTP